MTNAKRDENRVTTMLGVSNVDSVTPVPIKVNPVTGRIIAEIPGGSMGDVVGPSSAVDENIAVYDSTTGKLIKDGGVKLSELIVDGVQIYYVGKNGNDSNDGLTTEKSFLTFGAAITEATAQTPTSSNKFVIYCDDAGIYTEDITVPEYVDVKATSATLVGSATLADNQSIRFCEVNKIIKSSGTESTFVDICTVNTPSGELGINHTSDGELKVYARTIIVPLNGKGACNNGNGILHCNINDIDIIGDNGIGVHNTTGEINGRVDTIAETVASTGTIGVQVISGHIDLTSSNIECDTVYNVAASSILRLTVQHLVGTETVADGGDAQVSEASKSTDALAATGLVGDCGLTTINGGDSTLIDVTTGIYYIQGTRYVYAGGTGITPTIAGGDSSTWVGFDSSGLVYSATAFTTLQTQTILPLARLQAEQGESGPGSNLQSPIDIRFIISESGYLQRDYQENAFGVLYSTGGTYQESSTAFQIDQSAGVFYDPQGKPVPINADTDIVANELYHVSGSWTLQTDATLVTPKFYDDGTDIVALPNNRWASHTLLRAQKEEDSFVLVYSPAVYTSEAGAEAAGIYYGLFGGQASGFTAVASILIKGDASNISEPVDRRPFVGGNNPGVIGTATRQQVRDNSSTPETVTDSTRGAETWKRGSAADTDDVIEILNGSDVKTFSVTGEGVITGTVINTAKGSDIASATTTDIGAATGNFTDITGTTTITGLGTIQAGTQRTLQFDGILILTHNATSLILPTGADITTAAGDTCDMISLGSGNWICVNYQRADGTALASAGGGGGATSVVDATNSANQSIANSTTTVIDLDTTNIDLNSDFNTTTNRFVAPSNGYYSVSFEVSYADVTVGKLYQVSLYKNTTSIVQGFCTSQATTTTNSSYGRTKIVYLATSDYLELQTWQNSGAAVNINPEGGRGVYLDVHNIT